MKKIILIALFLFFQITIQAEINTNDHFNNHNNKQTIIDENGNEINYMAQVGTVIEENLKNDNSETWVNQNKKAIFLNYIKKIDEIENFTKIYQNNDIYAHNTIKNGYSQYGIYLVNIKKNDFEFLLSLASQALPTAHLASATRIRYFANNISSDNLFIKAGDKFNKNKKIIIKQDLEKNNDFETKNYNLSQETIVTKDIEKNKKTLLFSHKKNIDKTKKLVKKYQNNDTYERNTTKQQIKNTKIITENKKDKKPISYMSKIDDFAKKTSKTIVYFINATKFYLSINNIKKSIFDTQVYPQTNIKDNNTSQIQKIVKKEKKSLKIFTLNTIDTSKKAVTITNATTIKKAKKIAKKIDKLDIYIYKTTTTKIPIFVVYAVNIPKEELQLSIKNIRKLFNDAYASSDKRIKTLSSNNFNKNILIKSKFTKY